MIPEFVVYYQSPIGIMRITANEEAVTGLDFVDEIIDNDDKCGNTVLKECVDQMKQYFKGERKTFQLKLQPQGTEFQKRVWEELLKVPFGKTASYADIAIAAGNPRGFRAVGSANGRNRIAVIIPCHRIISSDGSMGGYSGGLWRKEWLLRHEGII
ncbi:MAG: methylated-DNA--[protein]-cysteine S-methyltransferase [Bacillota bacterium]|nr:methylated-DNA--[protein]-cysteine S-methyltransferase [Bacillota bacterium]